MAVELPKSTSAWLGGAGVVGTALYLLRWPVRTLWLAATKWAVGEAFKGELARGSASAVGIEDLHAENEELTQRVLQLEQNVIDTTELRGDVQRAIDASERNATAIKEHAERTEANFKQVSREIKEMTLAVGRLQGGRFGPYTSESGA